MFLWRKQTIHKVSAAFIVKNCRPQKSFILFHTGLLETFSPEGQHNSVVHAPTIMKLGTDTELDVLHTMVTKHFVTMLLLSNYDAITGIYADV